MSRKTFVFTNFSEALAFMVQVGMIAEKRNHHPDWTNRYNKVFIRLTTHDQGGVTDKDFELAFEIDRLLRN
jgi:4a-hydroxytetrahydrobiopterin dehydratase